MTFGVKTEIVKTQDLIHGAARDLVFMAKLSKWAIFMRAFIVALIASQPGRVDAQSRAEQSAWDQAQQQNTAQAYFRYLSLYPGGEFVSDALSALDRLGASSGTVRNLPTTRPQREQTPRQTRRGLY